MKRLLLVLTLTGAASLVAAAPLRAGDVDEFVTCTVQIDLDGARHEAPSSAPTVEEAADLAFESACALACVEAASLDTDAGAPDTDDVPAEDAPVEVTGDTPAVEDPDGVEACIEQCVELAELLGTHCTDAAARTVYADGSYDESQDADAPSDDDGDDDDTPDDADDTGHDDPTPH